MGSVGELRRLSARAMPLLVFAVLLGLTSSGRAEDTIVFNNRAGKKPKDSVIGSIVEESVQGVKIKPTKGDIRTIPAADILSISYQWPSNLSSLEMHRPLGRVAEIKDAKPGERPRRIDEAQKALRELIPKLDGAKTAQAYMEYRLALLLFELWDEEPSSARAQQAIEALAKWKQDHPKGWEYVRTLRMLARVQDAEGDRDGARKTYEEMAQRAELPADIRTGAGFALVRMALHAGQVAEANNRLDELNKLLAKDDPQVYRVEAYRIECRLKKGDNTDMEKQLKSLLAGPADDLAKAVASNALGDFYYQVAKKPEDAFWQYLWVDVLYNKDPEEHARALYQLIKLFREVRSDEARAEVCRKKLEDPEFAGIEYQRLAKAEEKK